MLTNDQSQNIFEVLCKKFEEYEASAEDMLSYLASTLAGTLAKNGVTEKNANKYFDELKLIFRDYKKAMQKPKKDPFIDHLGKVFDENYEGLKQAIEILEENPNEDGMLFSKGFRDKMEKFGDLPIEDALRNRDFWKNLCEHAGMSEEKFNEIAKND